MPTARQQLDLVQERNRLFKLREPKFGLGLKTVRELELISALSFLTPVKWPSASAAAAAAEERRKETKKRKKSGENRDFVLSRKTGGPRPGNSPESENGG